jgi:hypothetical protein
MTDDIDPSDDDSPELKSRNRLLLAAWAIEKAADEFMALHNAREFPSRAERELAALKARRCAECAHWGPRTNRPDEGQECTAAYQVVEGGSGECFVLTRADHYCAAWAPRLQP